LLAHAPSQQLNQTRLEAYLSAIAHPTFDIASHLSSPPRVRRTSSTPGTNTPRDLQISLKLLELYTLHVLPRNGEWDYAREFIMMSELLDDERKEVFLQALHELKEEKQQAAAREKELQRQQEEQLLRQKREEEEEIRRTEARRAEEEFRKREESKRQQRHPASSERQARDGYSRPKSIGPPRPSGGTASRPQPTPKKEIVRRNVADQTLYGRIGAIVTNLQSILLTTAQSLRTNPLLLLRTVLFILAFALAFGRREMRRRIKRTIEKAWLKIKGTAGMGLKVSSI
jgi:flagellar biosynthesis GTPase FlhF